MKVYGRCRQSPKRRLVALFARYYPKLVDYPELARHQYTITKTDGTGDRSIVACARSVPYSLFWPEIHSAGHVA